MRVTARRVSVLSVLCSAMVACGGQAPGGAPPGGAPGGRPPMPVDSMIVAARPVEQMSEFVAVLKSRTSVTIQPQAEGFLTRIAVQSGDRVARGALLFEIDAAVPQAALRTLESTRALRQTDVDHTRQELARARTLYAAGAISQRELQQAETLERSAAAALKVVDEQMQQTRTDLSYYRVVAPSAGVIGDVPVRTGDRVTRATALTVVDDNEALEAYVSVPVQQASALQLGLPTRIVDDRGTVLASNPVSYVSPTVEPTQTVLAKVALRDGRGQFRAQQLVRVQVIWSTAPAVTVPLTALSRINGQYFAFVMQPEGQGFVARQKGLTLGPLVGNDYVVQGGLAEGDRLITGGIQKIGEGAPVMPAPAGPPPSPAGQSAPGKQGA
jgi:RND family efflux transporter MFP subunit